MGSTAARDRVVLLHGQPGAGVEWNRVVERLGDRVDAEAPDRPGYGHNPLPAGGVAANVEWLAGLIEEAPGARPAILVAHSWSGSVALELARERPELVRGLVLVGSVGPGAVTPVDRLLARPVIGEVTAQSASVLVRPVVSRLLAFEERDERARAAVAGAVEANRSRGGWRTFLIEQRALVRELPALVGQLGFVEARTVVVAGTRDRVVPFATAKALVDRLPRAELVTVPRGGHRLHRTHPEVVAEAVKRQLL